MEIKTILDYNEATGIYSLFKILISKFVTSIFLIKWDKSKCMSHSILKNSVHSL